MNNMNEEANIEWLLVLQILSGFALLYDTDDYLTLTFLMYCQFAVGLCCILAKCNAQWWWWQQKQLIIKEICFY
jgi:hypothetical protein